VQDAAGENNPDWSEHDVLSVVFHRLRENFGKNIHKILRSDSDVSTLNTAAEDTHPGYRLLDEYVLHPYHANASGIILQLNEHERRECLAMFELGIVDLVCSKTGSARFSRKPIVPITITNAANSFQTRE
jgi:hypothetical protein